MCSLELYPSIFLKGPSTSKSRRLLGKSSNQTPEQTRLDVVNSEGDIKNLYGYTKYNLGSRRTLSSQFLHIPYLSLDLGLVSRKPRKLFRLDPVKPWQNLEPLLQSCFTRIFLNEQSFSLYKKFQTSTLLRC